MVAAPIVLVWLLVSVSSVTSSPSQARAVSASRDTTDSTEANRDAADRPWHDAAWNQIVAMSGVQISYIYYAEADEVNDGVVIKLENTQDGFVRVAFMIVFRSPNGEVTDRFATTLAPYEMKTGGNDGLYWIPFTAGETIGEVGLRGVEVGRIPPPPG